MQVSLFSPHCLSVENLLFIEVPHTSTDTTDMRRIGGRKEKTAEKIDFGKDGQ